MGRRARAALRRRALRRGHRRLRRPQPRRPRPRPARDGAGAEARRAGWSSSRSRSRPGRRSRPSSPSGSTASCRCSARISDEPEAYSYLPESVRSFPAPRGLAEKMDRAGFRRSGTPSSPAASSRSTAAPSSRVTPPLGRTAAGDGGPRRLPAAGCRRASARSRTCCASGRGLGRARSAEDAGATLAAGGKRLRPMLVLLCAGRGRRGGGGAGGDRDRARSTWRRWSTTTCSTRRRCGAACRPWRRPRAAAARCATGDLLLSRAFALLCEAGDARAVAAARRGRGRARPRRARPAPGRLRPRDLRRALPRALPAEDRDALRVRRLARPRRRPALRRFGTEVGLAFQLLDDVLDVTGPPERTGKARGTDLLDGTVTLPLIVAAEREPGLRRDRPAAGSTRPGPRRSATGSPRPGRWRRSGRGRSSWSPTGKRALGATGFGAEQRRLLELVADGVVQRYS